MTHDLLDNSRQRRMFIGALLSLVLGPGVLGGCSHSPITVPSGGQEVHVTVNGDTVRLEPTSVRAGDIYLVLEIPDTDVTLVESMAAADAPPGPLSDADLDRVAHGDTFHTSQTSGFPSGEPHGNVSLLVLTPGKYAFVADAPEMLAARSGGVIPPEFMAVLTVLP